MDITYSTIIEGNILPLFDYCNNLIFNIPYSSAQYTQLHWLSIYRILNKLSLITHKVIHYNSPDYLVPSLQLTTNNTITRSSNAFLIDTPILIIPTLFSCVYLISPLQFELITYIPSYHIIY